MGARADWILSLKADVKTVTMDTLTRWLHSPTIYADETAWNVVADEINRRRTAARAAR